MSKKSKRVSEEPPRKKGKLIQIHGEALDFLDEEEAIKTYSIDKKKPTSKNSNYRGSKKTENDGDDRRKKAMMSMITQVQKTSVPQPRAQYSSAHSSTRSRQ